MDRQQALDLVADLSARETRALWNAARPVRCSALRPGLYLGRACGVPRPMKLFVRHVVGRDYFAKLILDGWGVNVRVRQDGSHEPLASARVPGGFVVDLPFRVGDEALDYGFHALGLDHGFPGGLSQMRDFFRSLDFGTLAAVAPEEHLRRVGAARGEPGDAGELLLGYIAPLGVEALMGTPFGMVWRREATAAEVESARAHLRRRRLVDSSAGNAVG